MPTATYVPLATFTGSGTHAFTAIPQTYNHLVVVNHGIGTTAAENLVIQVGNGSYDANNNYTYRFNGTSSSSTGVGAGSNASCGGIFCGAIKNDYPNVSVTTILNYSSTSIQKNFITRNGGYSDSGQSNAIWVGQWITSGTAINQLKFTNTFAAGSTTTIYGLVA